MQLKLIIKFKMFEDTKDNWQELALDPLYYTNTVICVCCTAVELNEQNERTKSIKKPVGTFFRTL